MNNLLSCKLHGRFGPFHFWIFIGIANAKLLNYKYGYRFFNKELRKLLILLKKFNMIIKMYVDSVNIFPSTFSYYLKKFNYFLNCFFFLFESNLNWKIILNLINIDHFCDEFFNQNNPIYKYRK